MPQERHAQLSHLVDRSLRASLVLVILLTIAGVATAFGLKAVQASIAAGYELLVAVEGVNDDTQAMRLSMARWIIQGDSAARTDWTTLATRATERMEIMRETAAGDPVAVHLVDVLSQRLDERERTARPLLEPLPASDTSGVRTARLMGHDYQVENERLVATLRELTDHERHRLVSLRDNETLVLMVAGLALAGLVGWSVPTLRRSRHTARQLLVDLRGAIRSIELARAELQAFTNAVPLAVFHVDAGGTFKWLNDQANSWTGPVDDTGLGAVIRAAIHSDDRARVVAAWGALVGQSAPFEEVFRFTTPDGLLLWAQAHAAPVEVDGERTGFVAVMQDITDARILQDEVIRSRRRMRRLTDSVPALLARLDETETYRFVNATYRSWFGTSAPVPGATLQDFLGDAAYARLKPSFNKVRAGQAVRFEMFHENLHGRSFVGDTTYTPDLDDEGRYCGFYIMVTDISERKRLEERLFAAKELAQVTLDSIGHAVITTDSTGIVTSLNQRAEAMLQRAAGRAQGLPIDAVVHLTTPLGLPAETALLRAIEDERLVDSLGPRRLVHADGSHAVIEDVAAPIRERGGRIVGGVLVLRDVSETQALADRMRQLAESDALTGLPNRLVFDERLRTALAHASHTHPLAVLYMDLDGFKGINDTFGHDAGDAVLAEVAQRFLTTAGPDDTVCRLGGDEFVVLLPPPVSVHDALALAGRFVEAVREPFLWHGHSLAVTLSAGLAIAPDDGADALSLVRRADAALYAAKASGRNKVCTAADHEAARRPGSGRR